MENFSFKISALQLVASVLLFLGIQQFYVLSELDLIELIHSIGKDNFAHYVKKSDEFGISKKLKHLSTVKMILTFIGIVLGYIVMSIINYKRQVDWKVSVVISLICYIIFQFGIINLPINFISTKNLMIVYLVPATISIILSFILYFFSFRIKSI